MGIYTVSVRFFKHGMTFGILVSPDIDMYRWIMSNIRPDKRFQFHIFWKSKPEYIARCKAFLALETPHMRNCQKFHHALAVPGLKRVYLLGMH